MKIICTYLCNYSDRKDYYISLMPCGLTTIASSLESHNHEVILANFSAYGYKKGVEMTLSHEPGAVAVSIFSYNRDESFKYIRELKKRSPGIIIIAGGHHPTFLHDEIARRYPEIDFIIRGEGESAILRLLENIDESRGSRIISSERIADLDAIPYPSLFTGRTIGVNPDEQFKYIITSRGCPGRCTYCSSPSFWNRKVTYRSIANIIEELHHIRSVFGIIYFSIRDDNFTLNKKRVMEFCDLLVRSRLFMMWNCQARVDTIDSEMLIAMKRAGLEHIQFGVESGSEKILRAYDKSTTIDMIKRASSLTRDTGIYLSFYLMSGMHGETDEDTNATISLIRSTKPHDSIVSPVAYYPGTGIYIDGCRDGIIDNSVWFDRPDPGIFLDKTSAASRSIKRILKESGRIAQDAAYTTADIKKHRLTTGEGCWMNDIFEGDILQGEGDFMAASAAYERIIKMYPDNIWGWIRYSESASYISLDDSINALLNAEKIAPRCCEIKYRLAEIYHLAGSRKSAADYAKKAYSLNPMDTGAAAVYKKFVS